MWQPLKSLNRVSLVQYRAVRWKIRYYMALADLKTLSRCVHPPDNINITLSAYQRNLCLNLKQEVCLFFFFGLGSAAAQMASGQTVLFVVFDELDSFNLIQRCELNGAGLPKERLHLKTTALGNNPVFGKALSDAFIGDGQEIWHLFKLLRYTSALALCWADSISLLRCLILLVS